MEIRLKLTPRVPPLKVTKVIGTDTDRSAIYDLILTFHATTGLSYTVSEINGDFSRKSQKFPTHPPTCMLRLSTEGVPVGIG